MPLIQYANPCIHYAPWSDHPRAHGIHTPLQSACRKANRLSAFSTHALSPSTYTKQSPHLPKAEGHTGMWTPSCSADRGLSSWSGIGSAFSPNGNAGSPGGDCLACLRQGMRVMRVRVSCAWKELIEGPTRSFIQASPVQRAQR